MHCHIQMSRGYALTLITSVQMDERSLNVKITTLALCLSSMKKQTWFLLLIWHSSSMKLPYITSATYILQSCLAVKPSVPITSLSLKK